jgi:hypothetical protein
MSTERIPDDVRVSTERCARAQKSRGRIAEALEAEIARLKELRPSLKERIDRASHLLVVHLSDPRSGTIRVRVGSNGRPRFVVRSLASAGVYVVDPSDSWRCSCPDHHRRDAACKHAIACWCLKRAADRGAQRKGCALCVNGWVHLGERLIDRATGEVMEATNVVPCRRCRDDDMSSYLSDDQLREWMEEVPWRYAKSMPRHPHSYTLKKWQDPELFEMVVQTIWDLGYDRSYLRRPWRSLDVGDYYVWVHTVPERGMSAPLEKTALINRALRIQERLV